jgi:hypothetical protein
MNGSELAPDSPTKSRHRAIIAGMTWRRVRLNVVNHLRSSSSFLAVRSHSRPSSMSWLLTPINRSGLPLDFPTKSRHHAITSGMTRRRTRLHEINHPHSPSFFLAVRSHSRPSGLSWLLTLINRSRIPLDFPTKSRHHCRHLNVINHPPSSSSWYEA